MLENVGSLLHLMHGRNIRLGVDVSHFTTENAAGDSNWQLMFSTS
jgi:hypothetical protein